MTLTEKDELLAQIDILFYTSFLLQCLDTCGEWMDTSEYSNSILEGTRWYVLEKQLEELRDLNEYVCQKSSKNTVMIKKEETDCHVADAPRNDKKGGSICHS